MVVACRAADEPPPVASPPLEVEAGVLPVAPPPPRVLAHPTDIGECLPPSFPHSEVPVVVTVSYTGKALSLDFRSPCGGEVFTVSQPISDCIRAKLTQWEWLIVDDGPAFAAAKTTPYGEDALVAVKPEALHRKTADSDGLPFTAFGCSAGG